MKPRPPLPPGPYLVIGLARSGVAAALALRARWEEVIGCDAGEAVAAFANGIARDGAVAADGAAFEVEDRRALAAEASALLSLTGDRLDRRGTFEADVTAKLEAFRRQGNHDRAVFPCDLGLED